LGCVAALDHGGAGGRGRREIGGKFVALRDDIARHAAPDTVVVVLAAVMVEAGMVRAGVNAAGGGGDVLRGGEEGGTRWPRRRKSHRKDGHGGAVVPSTKRAF